MQPIFIFWTCKNRTEGRRITTALLKKHLIACASIIPNVESIYHWKGKIETAKECQVIFKTVRRQFLPVRDYIVEHCSYEIPEIIEVIIEQGNPAYLTGLQNSTQ